MNENLPPDAMLSIWELAYVFVASACGAVTSLLLRLIEMGKVTKIEAFATVFIGICFAMFLSNLIGVFFDIPSGISLTLGGSAYMSGMVGMRAARYISKKLNKLEGGQ